MEKKAIQNKEKNFVSCVLYLHNDGKHIREFLKTVCGTMERNFEKYEIVCVNDCCTEISSLNLTDVCRILNRL